MSGYTYRREELDLEIYESARGGMVAVAISRNDVDRRTCILVDDSERQAAAQALAGDGYEVVPKLAEWERELLAKQQAGYDIETAQRDLRRIMAELGMSLHARTESSHEVVIREVLPRIRELKAAEPSRPPAIDPADVRVGDVVEVEAADGSWLVRGEVTELDPASPPYRFRLWIARHGHDGIWPRLTGATVRLVRRAEPEVDPEQVEALAELVGIAAGATTTEVRPNKWQQMARELIRRGVTVRKET